MVRLMKKERSVIIKEFIRKEMGQTCCGNKPDDAELNAHKTQGHRGERQNFDPEKQENGAAITMQRYFKGLMTRRFIKAQYGFEAKHTAF